jgi:hypothetical protein
MTQDPSLTSYAARLIEDTPAGRIPRDVMRLAKCSILDGIGPAKPNAEKIVDLVLDFGKAKKHAPAHARAGDSLRFTDRQNPIRILTPACRSYRILQTACRRLPN